MFRKNYLIIYVGALVLILNGCKKTKEPDAIAEIPKILSVSIPGILQENIDINEQERLITVVAPKTLPSLKLVPSFTVSERAKINGNWGSGKKTISFVNYCPCINNHSKESDFDKIENIRLDNETKTGYYKIQLVKSDQPLRIVTTTGPVSFYSKSTSNKIYFPVENYYGSSYVQYIAITKSGSALPNWISEGEVCFDTCEGRLNEIGLSVSGYLIGPFESSVLSFKPGFYDLDLRLFDETEIHIDKAILMK